MDRGTDTGEFSQPQNSWLMPVTGRIPTILGWKTSVESRHKIEGSDSFASNSTKEGSNGG